MKRGAFMLQCALVFSKRPISFATDLAKIQYIIGLLRGRALDWVMALWESLTVFAIMLYL